MLQSLDLDNAPLPVIFGIEGEKLSKDEKSFFKEANPLGFILFARNCVDPEQLSKLTKSLHDLMGREVPILIDQEGGRVQRLKEPHWKAYPAAAHFGQAFLRNFTEGQKELASTVDAIATDLQAAGVNVNCAPVLDVRGQETHNSIGDRTFSNEPEVIAALGGMTARIYLERGIVPVIKHLPGLGRAGLDTHEKLPEVTARLDDLRTTEFLPYKEILTKPYSEALWGMIGHAVYTAVDARAPASCSRRVIWDVVRGDIGFRGLLLSDDIDMGALSVIGDAGDRATQALKAGCDVVLQCNGKLSDMQNVAKRIQKMTNDSLMRYNRSVTWVIRNFKDDKHTV